MINLTECIQKALLEASNAEEHETNTRIAHSTRSSNFVSAIAEYFKSYYSDENIRVLSRKRPSNKEEFSVNELLYDITVCTIGKTPAKRKGFHLTFITGAIWEIESELEDGDYREALTDFNKLVLGDSENKLFIGTTKFDNDFLLKTLALPAAKCRGNIYVALISHPRSWKNSISSVQIWQYHTQEGWKKVA